MATIQFAHSVNMLGTFDFDVPKAYAYDAYGDGTTIEVDYTDSSSTYLDGYGFQFDYNTGKLLNGNGVVTGLHYDDANYNWVYSVTGINIPLASILAVSATASFADDT